MSSSAVVNGGAPGFSATTTTTTTTAAAAQDVLTFAHWEPEDLVQLLATLDESHAMLPYVLPEAVICESKRPAHLIEYHHQPSPDTNGHDDNDDDMNDAVKAAPRTTNDQTTPISEIHVDASSETYDETASSASAVQTPCSTEERSIIRASNKPTQLKRVSFGSSKGSMVETLIYESPIIEEEPVPFGVVHSNRLRSGRPNSRTPVLKSAGISSAPLLEEVALHTFTSEESSSRPASKVRVTFYESERPLTISSPEPSESATEISDWEATTYTMAAETSATPTQLTRQLSTESGQDNPFRPDGDLSREADEIVELFKGGRPLSEALKPKDDSRHEEEVDVVDSVNEPLIGSSTASQEATPKTGTNGKAAGDKQPTLSSPLASPASSSSAPQENVAPVEVQHAVVVTPANDAQVEHVVIKKKGKCKCCVIQ